MKGGHSMKKSHILLLSTLLILPAIMTCGCSRHAGNSLADAIFEADRHDGVKFSRIGDGIIPEPDKSHKTVLFTFLVSGTDKGNAKLKAKIIDSKKDVVREFDITNKEDSGGKWLYTWDAKDGKGNLVKNGEYSISAKVSGHTRKGTPKESTDEKAKNFKIDF